MRAQHNNSNRLLGPMLAILAGVLLLASLPFLGVVSVIVRVTLLAAAALAAVGGILMYRASPRFRDWFTAKLDEQPQYKGLRLRDGISLAAGHSWLRSERSRAIVGVDDLLQRVLGPVDSVDLPPAGQRVRRGLSLMSLQHGDRRITLRAPLDGTVVRRNTTLLEDPTAINRDPYGRGWAVEIREETPSRRVALHDGVDARHWFQDEVDRLLTSIQSRSQYGPAMADGGTLVPDLYRVLDDACWRRVHREFFDIPQDED